jgi:hypothetical protein
MNKGFSSVVRIAAFKAAYVGSIPTTPVCALLYKNYGASTSGGFSIAGSTLHLHCRNTSSILVVSRKLLLFIYLPTLKNMEESR